jgi:DNA-binding beta-propeller fold protein YncE
VKSSTFSRPAGRGRPWSHAVTRRRSASSWLKFVLLASLAIAPNAAPVVQDGGASVPLQFQGEARDQFGGLRRPSRIAVSDQGEIYVSDTGRGVVAIFDAEGRRVGTLTGFQQPLGLAVSVAKRCNGCGGGCRQVQTAYVGDQSDGSVAVFEDGQRRRLLGSGPGEFLRPNGIAVTSTQTVYVADSGANQIKMFGSNGGLVRSFGTPGWGSGQLDFPTDIVFDETRSELYVAEHNNRRISVFDPNGVWLRCVFAPYDDQGNPVWFRIAGLGLGPAGSLYVVDSALSSVAIVASDGSLLDQIGYRQGSYWTGDLKVPIDAATDGSSLYVTSSTDHLVKVFGALP